MDSISLLYPHMAEREKHRDRNRDKEERGRDLESSHIRALCAVQYQVASLVCDSLLPVDSSLPGPSVHGILQARILEVIAIPSSRGFS